MSPWEEGGPEWEQRPPQGPRSQIEGAPYSQGRRAVEAFGNCKVLWTVRACFLIRASALPLPEPLVVTVKAPPAFSHAVLTVTALAPGGDTALPS